MEQHLAEIIASIGAFFGVIIAYILGLFTLLGTAIAALTTFLMTIWAAVLAFFTWLLPASFISALGGLFGWVYPIVAKIAPFLTVGKNGQKAYKWLKARWKKAKKNVDETLD